MHRLQRRLSIGLAMLAAVTTVDGAHVARGQAAASTSSTRGVLASDYLRLTFDLRTGSVAGIRVRSPGARDHGGDELVGARDSASVLWRLIFGDSTGRSDTVDNVHAGAPTFTRSRSELVLTWASVRAPSGAPMRVTARVHLAPHDSSAELRLSAVPAAGGAASARGPGLVAVDFPVLPALAGTARDAVAQPRTNAGVLVHAPTRAMGGVYPSLALPMQFMLVDRGSHGLYLAAHDAAAWPKRFQLTPGRDFVVSTDVENAGAPLARFDAPYPFVVGAYYGGWMRGAKRYRAWVTAQSWAREAPLRTPGGNGIADVDLWLVDGLNTEVLDHLTDLGTPADVADRAIEVARRTGAHVGVHWYRWSHNAFDADYPNYFPERDGFAAAVRRARAAGIVAMPYINGRLWDTTTPNFPAARGAATKGLDGRVRTEVYRTSNRVQAVMCPATRLWQDTLRALVERLVTDDGLSAVYLDQIGAARPVSCFDAAHGHAPGGGAWWVAGYRELLRRIRAWARDAGKPLALTTELPAEPYMDGVDGYLIQTPRSSDDIPLLTAVYSGYTIYFGTPEPLEHGDVSFALGQARDWTWGEVPGWMYPHHLLEPEHARKLAFLGTLARTRSLAATYLVRGELLGALSFDTTVVPLGSGDWAGIGWGGHTAGSRPFRLPVVQSAVWRGADGSLGVVMANADSVAHTVPLSLDCRAWTCPAGPLRIAVRRVGAEARAREESRRTVTASVTLAPFGAAVVEIRGARDVGAAERR